MKHQYFGDTRDLFKYDLLIELALGIPVLRRILFIPMLTPDDKSRGGTRTVFRDNHAGYRNVALRRFLSAHHTSRDITLIADYFRKRGIGMDMFGPAFTAQARSAYFASAARFCTGVPGSLIFIDPDIGLEVRHPDERHLLFTELHAVCRAADPPFLLMIYQHFPRVTRDSYVRFRLAQLQECCDRPPLALGDGQVVFFLLPSGEVADQVSSCLHRYAGHYPVLRCWP